MTQTAYTEGPWEVAEGGIYRDGERVAHEIFVRRPEHDVAIASEILDPNTCEPSMANARLIAAAPALLEAGVRVDKAFEAWSVDESWAGPLFEELANAVEALHAAIAQTRGEA